MSTRLAHTEATNFEIALSIRIEQTNRPLFQISDPKSERFDQKIMIEMIDPPYLAVDLARRGLRRGGGGD